MGLLETLVINKVDRNMRDLLTELAYELSTEDIEEEEEAEEEEDETTYKDSDIDSVSNNGAAAVATRMSFPGIPTNEPLKQPTIEVPITPQKQSDNSSESTGVEGGSESGAGDIEEDE